jgi:hypothetical protein
MTQWLNPALYGFTDLRIINALASFFVLRLKTSFLPFKGRIKVGMGLQKSLYKPILTPALSLKERVIDRQPLIRET